MNNSKGVKSPSEAGVDKAHAHRDDTAVLVTSPECSDQIFIDRMCAMRGSDLGDAELE